MKKIALILIGTFFVIPFLTQARVDYVPADSFSLSMNSLALWLAVAVAVIATASVFWDAKRIQGGVLGQVYTYFGVGMLLILAGFIVLIIKPLNINLVFLSLHDIFYIIGYLIVAIGAKKIISEYKK